MQIRELKERISELLRLVEEGETIEVTSRDKVIARLIPATQSEPTQERNKDALLFWANLDQLAVQIGTRWKDDMDTVDTVRDVRREL